MLEKRSHPFVFFTGSFDPVHEGHIELIRIGLDALMPCEFVVFLNAIRPGKILTPLEQRKKALIKAAQGLSCCIADDHLLEAYNQGGEEALLERLMAINPRRSVVRIAGLDSLIEAKISGKLSHNLRLGIRQYVVPSPGYALANLHLPEEVKVLQSTGLQISSTDLRAL